MNISRIKCAATTGAFQLAEKTKVQGRVSGNLPAAENSGPGVRNLCSRCLHAAFRIGVPAVLTLLLSGCDASRTELEALSSETDSQTQRELAAKQLSTTPDGPSENPVPDQSADLDSDSDDLPSENSQTADSVVGDDTSADTSNEPQPDTDPATKQPTGDVTDAADSESVSERPQGTKLPADLLEGSQLTPLNPQATVLLDLMGKRILLKANVCLTEGLLEMLLCPHQTKEHESILSTKAQAYTVHTGLLALGCKEGQAARYNPETEEYIPASGQVIDIYLHWVDKDGKLHRKPAQSWVRRSRQRYYQARFESLPADLKLEPDGNLRYDDVNQFIFWYGPMNEQERDQCLKMSSDKKFQQAIHQFYQDGQEQPMSADWVFVGSGFYEDDNSAKQYLAEGGYMICVANFAMAMIDVSTPSDSNGTESLAYEAATERIPPRGSEVLIELIPRPAGKATNEKTDSAQKQTETNSPPPEDSEK